MCSSYDGRVLEDKLAWNVYITDVYSNEAERKARSSTDVTYVKIIAFDEANQEVPADDVKRSVWHSLCSRCQSYAVGVCFHEGY